MSCRIFRRDLYVLAKAANRSGKMGREVCGLLVRVGNHLALVPVVNSATDLGSFELTPRRMDAAVMAGGFDWKQVAGTYHSHPASSAEPGPRDIAEAAPRSLMLIYSCSRGEAKLWRIRNGKADPVRFLKATG